MVILSLVKMFGTSFRLVILKAKRMEASNRKSVSVIEVCVLNAGQVDFLSLQMFC